MGNPHSPILLVGDFPGYYETKVNSPVAFRSKPTETRSGDILKDELLKVGIMLNGVLVTNLWQHQKAYKTETTITKTGKEKSKQVEACPLAWHLDQLVNLFQDRTHVLLMGSDVTQALLGEKVGSLSGLRVYPPALPKSKIHFWVSPNPALAFSQPIGELRLAFSRFAEDVQGKKKVKIK